MIICESMISLLFPCPASFLMGMRYIHLPYHTSTKFTSSIETNSSFRKSNSHGNSTTTLPSRRPSKQKWEYHPWSCPLISFLRVSVAPLSAIYISSRRRYSRENNQKRTYCFEIYQGRERSLESTISLKVPMGIEMC